MEDKRGNVAGLVDMVDCIPTDNTYEKLTLCEVQHGMWGFVLENPRLLDRPCLYKGKLGIFEIEQENILRSISRQLCLRE